MPSAVDTTQRNTKNRGATGYLPGEAGMWFFIIGDLIIFSVYFVFYVYSRGQEPAVFLEGQRHLNQGIGVLNTVVLLTSSLFVALATEAASDRRNSDAFRLMAVGLAFGALFPALKIIEWIPKLSAGLTPGESLFYMYYYLITGMHLCHVLLGLIILSFVLWKLYSFKDQDMRAIETSAIYWHMVDLLWVIMFAVLYLLR